MVKSNSIDNERHKMGRSYYVIMLSKIEKSERKKGNRKRPRPISIRTFICMAAVRIVPEQIPVPDTTLTKTVVLSDTPPVGKF